MKGNSFDFGPFIAIIVFSIIVIIVVDRISKTGAVGSGIDTDKPGGQYAERRARRNKPEDVQKNLLYRIKLFGIVAGLCYLVSFISLAYIFGVMLEIYPSEQGDINLALSALIVGVVLAVIYTLQFINNRQLYEKYYGSIFKQK